MFCTVTLDGIPLGQVELSAGQRAIGFLAPFDAYTTTGFQAHVWEFGRVMTMLGWSRVGANEVGRSLAAILEEFATLQDRLALLDTYGQHIAIVQIVVVEFPGDDVPVVVAHLRDQAAPVPAVIRCVARRQRDSTRPAA